MHSIPASDKTEKVSRSCLLRTILLLRPVLAACIVQKGEASSSPSDFKWTSALLSASAIVLLPLLVFIPEDGAAGRAVLCVWGGLLHISPWPVAFVAGGAAVWLSRSSSVYSKPNQSVNQLNKRKGIFRMPRRPLAVAVILTIVVGLSVLISAQLDVFFPDILWFPFLWGRYRVYHANELEPALKSACLNKEIHTSITRRKQSPLCLNEAQWDTLSSGYLSSRNADDVRIVQQGIQYAGQSGGLVIAILARDTVDAIGPLRKNVEALRPFFHDKLTVVVFENDSVDGTRDAFKAWAAEAENYSVELLDCGEDAPDCKLKSVHRYSAAEGKADFNNISVVGRMAEYRQKTVRYILDHPNMTDYR